MLGLNSGLLGVRRVPTTVSASGLWEPNEQSLARRAGIWPTLPDPSFSSVSLLLHMNGANNSTVFTDSSSNTLTATPSGDTKIDTSQFKFGDASAFFDGASDQLNIADANVLDLSGDFTIELWVRPSSTPTSTYPIVAEKGTGSAATDNWGIILDNSLTTKTGSFFYGTPRSYADLGTIPQDAWTYLAISRSGTSLRTFNAGTLVTTATVSNNFTNTSVLRLGTAGGSTVNPYKGHIDELRITKGVARYTASFTAPTDPFPDY